MKIDNPKVASPAPDWAPFAGCTIIFNRFGVAADRQTGADLPAAVLHTALQETLAGMDRGPWNDVGFCPLPPATYHVTVADLVHAGNVGKIIPKAKAGFVREDGKMLAPEIVARQLAPLAARSGLLDVDTADLAFAFVRAINRGNRVVTAELTPAPEPRHRAAFERLITAREALAASLKQALGITLPAFAPHVSLGYFANRGRAAQSEILIDELNRRLMLPVRGRVFAYGRPALYLFSDMANYCKAS